MPLKKRDHKWTTLECYLTYMLAIVVDEILPEPVGPISRIFGLAPPSGAGSRPAFCAGSDRRIGIRARWRGRLRHRHRQPHRLRRGQIRQLSRPARSEVSGPDEGAMGIAIAAAICGANLRQNDCMLGTDSDLETLSLWPFCVVNKMGPWAMATAAGNAALRPPRQGNATSFKPGQPGGPGRPRHSRNRMQVDLAQEILVAAGAVGFLERDEKDKVIIKRDENGEYIFTGHGGLQGFLRYCAAFETKTFLALLARTIPYHIIAAEPERPDMTREEAVAMLRERGIPVEMLEYLRQAPVQLDPGEDPDPYGLAVDVEPESVEIRDMPAMGSTEGEQGAT